MSARASTPAVNRRALLAKVHVARKQLAMEEDSYRALLRRITGKDSAGDCADSELVAVVEAFKKLGFAAPRRKSDKPHVRKIFALWTALKPFLTNPSDDALGAFVSRQTGIARPEWLNAQQANRVTEGLKAWLAREQAKVPADG